MIRSTIRDISFFLILHGLGLYILISTLFPFPSESICFDANVMGKTGQVIAQKKDPTIGPELDAKLMEASSQSNEAKAEEKKVKYKVSNEAR